MVNWDNVVKVETSRITQARKELTERKAERVEASKGAKRVISMIEAALKDATKVEDDLADDIDEADQALVLLKGEVEDIDEIKQQMASVDKAKDLKPLIKLLKMKAEASPDDIKKQLSFRLKLADENAKAYSPRGWDGFEKHVSDHAKAVSAILKVVESCKL